MISKTHIEGLIKDAMMDTDLFVVEMDVKAGNYIHVVIDADSGVSVADCMKVSRGIEHNLDREVEDFELRVESAGADRPFKILRQYIKNVGREVDVKFVDGRRLEGLLEEADDQGIKVKTKAKERIEGRKAKQWVEEVHSISYPEIAETKVVLLFNKKK